MYASHVETSASETGLWNWSENLRRHECQDLVDNIMDAKSAKAVHQCHPELASAPLLVACSDVIDVDARDVGRRQYAM
jgi:hypothetical protein